MNIKSKTFLILSAVILLAILFGYLFLKTPMNQNVEENKEKKKPLILEIQDFNFTPIKNDLYELKIQLSAENKCLVLTSVKLLSQNKIFYYIESVSPNLPLNISYQVKVLKLFMHIKYLKSYLPKNNFTSPTRSIQLLNQAFNKDNIFPKFIRIYFKPCKGKIIYHIDFSLYKAIVNYIKSTYYTTYDYSIIELSARGGSIATLGVINNNVEITFKSYSNKTIHITRLEFLIYSKKTHELVSRQVIHTNIILDPHEVYGISFTIKTPWRLWDYYLVVYAYSREGVVRYARTDL